MKVKTYGINGLTEWHGEVKAGSISVKVSFTGGTASPSGSQPAYYVTKDPIAQFVIENSKEFKSGFIYLEMSQDMPGDHPRMAMPKKVTASKEEEGAPSASDSHDTQEEAAEEPTEDADGASSNKMEFSCNEDAKDYLAEKYGVVKSKLLTRKAIEDAAKENGIDIVWTK